MADRGRAQLWAVALLIGSWALGGRPVPPAQQVLAAARDAIGGDARLQAVTSLSVKATVEAYPPKANLTLTSEVQIDILLPERYLITQVWPSSFFKRVGGFDREELIEQKWLSSTWSDVGFERASKEARARQLAWRRRECARYLLAWLLGAPGTWTVELAHGHAMQGGTFLADVLEARGPNGFAARLFFDSATHRLLMLTYRDPPVHVTTAAEPRATGPEKDAPLFKAIEGPGGAPDETRMQFEDYRIDDGILFAHRIHIEREGVREEWKISRFKVNPPLDPAQFRKR